VSAQSLDLEASNHLQSPDSEASNHLQMKLEFANSFLSDYLGKMCFQGSKLMEASMQPLTGASAGLPAHVVDSFVRLSSAKMVWQTILMEAPWTNSLFFSEQCGHAWRLLARLQQMCQALRHLVLLLLHPSELMRFCAPTYLYANPPGASNLSGPPQLLLHLSGPKGRRQIATGLYQKPPLLGQRGHHVQACGPNLHPPNVHVHSLPEKVPAARLPPSAMA